jgi:hypothetical protein
MLNSSQPTSTAMLLNGNARSQETPATAAVSFTRLGSIPGATTDFGRTESTFAGLSSAVGGPQMLSGFDRTASLTQGGQFSDFGRAASTFQTLEPMGSLMPNMSASLFERTGSATLPEDFARVASSDIMFKSAPSLNRGNALATTSGAAISTSGLLQGEQQGAVAIQTQGFNSNTMLWVGQPGTPSSNALVQSKNFISGYNHPMLIQRGGSVVSQGGILQTAPAISNGHISQVKYPGTLCFGGAESALDSQSSDCFCAGTVRATAACVADTVRNTRRRSSEFRPLGLSRMPLQQCNESTRLHLPSCYFRDCARLSRSRGGGQLRLPVGRVTDAAASHFSSDASDE